MNFALEETLSKESILEEVNKQRLYQVNLHYEAIKLQLKKISEDNLNTVFNVYPDTQSKEILEIIAYRLSQEGVLTSVVSGFFKYYLRCTINLSPELIVQQESYDAK